MDTFFDVLTTPFGSFAAAVDDSGALVAAVFGAEPELQRRLRSRSPGRHAPDRLGGLRIQLAEYADGTRRAFSLRLAPAGSPFQQRVWRALGAIPWGQTRSYGDLARDLGTSPRAIGRANALNPICLVVPCHRVIGADGSLTGYAFGEDRKRRLLEHEGWRAPA